MKTLLALAIIVTLVSCQTQTKEPDNTAKNQPIKELVEKEEVVQETFMEFFENFMWDSTFQKQRIEFPIDFLGQQEISKDTWKYLRFYRDKQDFPILHTDTVTYFEKDIEEKNVTMSILYNETKTVKNYIFSKDNNGWKLLSAHNQPIDSLADIVFYQFLNQISSDSIFLKNHIKFPLPYYNLDYDYGIVIDTLNADNWVSYINKNQWEGLMTLNRNMDSDIRMIYHRGVDNGIYLKLTFKKHDDRWMLTKLEDYSM